MEFALAATLLYCVAREIIFIVTVHKLMNKLMSRNYHEYKLAESVGKQPKPVFNRVMDDDLHEDFGSVM